MCLSGILSGLRWLVVLAGSCYLLFTAAMFGLLGESLTPHGQSDKKVAALNHLLAVLTPGTALDEAEAVLSATGIGYAVRPSADGGSFELSTRIEGTRWWGVVSQSMVLAAPIRDGLIGNLRIEAQYLGP